MTPTSALLVALGGALGALARVGLGLWLTRVYAPSFPSVTLGVNTLGCLLLGILVGLTPSDDEAQRMARLALGGGFLGAFTTCPAWMPLALVPFWDYTSTHASDCRVYPSGLLGALP